jgi:hypothetical protein
VVIKHRGWPQLRAGLLAGSLLLPSLFGVAPAFASTLPAVFTDHFTDSSLTPLAVAGGNWAVANGLLTASNYGIHLPLDKQFVYMPTQLTNEVVLAEVSITATPANGNWRIGIFTHGTGTANPQKWALILQGDKLSLLDENTSWVSQMPFTSSPGQTYYMELAVEGTTVNGRVWASNQPEPTNWTISGKFPPNQARFGKGAGMYVANADASFSTFQVMVAPPALTVTPNDPGAIFVQGHASGYTASVTNDSGEAGQYNIQYTVDDINGNPVDSGSVPVSVPAVGVSTVTLPVPIPELGYYTVSFALTSPVGFPVSTLPATSLAEVPPAANIPPSSNPIGMNGNLTYTATTGATGNVSDAFEVLREQGIGWYRLNLNASTIFPHGITQGNWESLDRLVSAAHSQNVSLLGLLTAWPAGMNPFGAKANVSFSTALNAYVSYVQKVVKRYGPAGTLASTNGWDHYGISTWELWNEPVTASYWGGTAAQYAELAEAAAQAIRAIEPNATILAYDDVPANLVAQGSGLYSGLSLHYYPGVLPPDNPTFSVYGAVQQNVSWASQVGGTLWLTEAGWSTKEVSAEAQAQDWVETVLDSLTAGASHVMLFTQIYPDSGFSEEHQDLTPKISYPALAAVDRRLAGYTPVGRLNLGASLVADAFSNGSDTMVALWSPEGDGELTLPPETSPVLAFDWMDNPIDPDGPSRLAVPLSASPVYLVFPNTSVASASALLNQAEESNIAPVSLSVAPVSSANPLAPSLAVTVSNVSNRPVSGNLSLTLPLGWTGSSSATPGAAVYNPSTTIPAIPVGGTYQAVFNLNASATVSRYRVIVSMTSSTGGPPTTVSATVADLLTGDRPSVQQAPQRPRPS